MKTLTLRGFGTTFAVDSTARTISGTITLFDTLVESHHMMLHQGCLEPRMPLTRVKLLRDHEHGDPVGYMLEHSDDLTEATFSVATGENGDRVLHEAAEHLRDGFSVGFAVREYAFDAEDVLHIYRAELYEVSVCAIPAIPDAQVTDVAAALAASRKENNRMNREQLRAALSAGTITQATYDAEIAKLDAASPPTPQAPATPVPAELAAGPADLPASTPAATTRERGLSLREVTRRVAAAVNTGDVREVILELADVIPANDAGEGYANRPEWLGELFTANETSRPYIEALGSPQPLTALRAKGYRWADKPQVGEYAGDKTEIPTNAVSTVGDDFVAFRIAAGWDIDRAYVDFGDEAFLTDFWTHVVADYQIKSETGIRTRLKALTTNAVDTVTEGGVLAVLKQVIRDGRRIPGAKVNRIFLDDLLFEELEDIPTEKLPLWLKSATIGMDIAEGTANVGDLRIGLDSTLVAGETVAFDSRGFIPRERQVPQVRAVDLAHGGIDLGFFSYLRLDDVDPRLIFRRQYTAAPVV